MLILRSMILVFCVGVLGCQVEYSTSSNSASTPVHYTEMTIGGIQLAPKTLLDGKVSMLIPKDFTILDEETLRAKYPKIQRPTLVYSDEDAHVNIALRITDQDMTQAELPSCLNAMEQSMRKAYPTANWYNAEIKKSHGRDWFFIEVTTPARDTDIHNLMVGTSVNGKLLIVSFNARIELEDTWLAPAEAIIESIQITE